MKKKLTLTAFIFTFAVLMSSCMITKTPVGNFREANGSTYTYAKGKQVWLFWNLIPLGRTSVATPTSGSCLVITKFNLIDILVSGLTAGIVDMETIKVEAKK